MVAAAETKDSFNFEFELRDITSCFLCGVGCAPHCSPELNVSLYNLVKVAEWDKNIAHYIPPHPCSSIMAAQTLEQKKQMYSRQLAAHTFRQWNAVRQNQSGEKEDEPDSKGSDILHTHDEKQSRFGGDQQTHTSGRQDQNKNPGQSLYTPDLKYAIDVFLFTGTAVQVVDYGRTSEHDCDVSKERSTRIAGS
jgi:hypothetical protein